MKGKKQKKLRGSTRSILRLELTPGVQSGDSDLDKAGQLKNKYRKLRPAPCQHLRSMGWDTAMPPSFQSYGCPKPPSLTSYIPARGAPSLGEGSWLPRGYLSSCCSGQPQCLQVVWGWGWPPAVQFSRSSWPLLKRWGLGSTFTQGASAQGWGRAQPPGAIHHPPTGQGLHRGTAYPG